MSRMTRNLAGGALAGAADGAMAASDAPMAVMGAAPAATLRLLT